MESGSTFSGNSAINSNGGAIDNGDDGGMGTLNMSGSTFSGNSAGDDGGAIDNGDDGGSATLIVGASTLSGSSAGTDGGTIANGEGSGTGTVWAAADIFSGSCAQAAGAWNDEGYNVGSDASCLSATPASTDTDSAGAGLGSLLGPLANNGGPTETILPLPGNPALSIVPNATSVTLNGTTSTLCPTTDHAGWRASRARLVTPARSKRASPWRWPSRSLPPWGPSSQNRPGRCSQAWSTPTLARPHGRLELTATATDATVAVFPDGTFTYAPATGFIGTDSFSYTLTDNLGYVSAPATVTVTVGAAPVPTTTTLTSTAAPPVVPAPTTTTTTPTTTTSPPRPFPHSGQSYPNGAIVSFAGHDYVFAGGRAFSGSTGELAALEKVDHAKETSAPAGVAPLLQRRRALARCSPPGP